jgi:hypothetical protein
MEAAQLSRRFIIVTYNDGRVEEYQLKPKYEYEASKRVPNPDSQLQVTWMQTWLAAGKPCGGFEDWIQTVADISGRLDETSSVPPTNGSTQSE